MMVWFSRIHEGGLLRDLDQEEREVVSESWRQWNHVVARAFAPVLICVAILMGWVDVQRLQAGKFHDSWLYGTLAVLHVVFVLSLAPALWLRIDGHTASLRARAVRIHLYLLLSSLVGMAVLSIVERNTFALLAGTMLTANFIYRIPLRSRLHFNLVTFILCTVGMLASAVSDMTDSMPRVTEIVALVLASALVGGMQARQQVISVLAEHRLAKLVLVDALAGRRHIRRALRRPWLRCLDTPRAASCLQPFDRSGRTTAAKRPGRIPRRTSHANSKSCEPSPAVPRAQSW